MAPSNLKWAGGAKNLRLSVLSRNAVAKSDCKEVLEEIGRKGLMNYSEKAVMEIGLYKVEFRILESPAKRISKRIFYGVIGFEKNL